MASTFFACLAHCQTVEINAGDYPSINAAVAACGTANNCVVTVPAGQHNLINTVTLNNGVRIVGETGAVIDAQNISGGTAFLGRGTAVSRTTTTNPLTENPYYVYVASVENLEPGDMVEFGQGLDTHVNEILSVPNPSTLRLRYPVPFFVEANQTVQEITPLHAAQLQNLKIINSSNPFYFDYARDLQIENLEIENNSLYGVFYRSLRGRIKDSSVLNSSGGFFVSSSTDVLVANNRVDQNKLAAYFVRGCSQVQVSNNTARSTHDYATGGQSGDGYTFVKSQWVNVNDNTSTDASCYGLWADNVRDCTFTSNTITNSYTSGYYVTTSERCTLQHNTAQNLTTAHGFAVSSGSNHVFTNNTAKNTVYGFVMLGTDKVIYGRNVATGCVLEEFLHNNTETIFR